MDDLNSIDNVYYKEKNGNLKIKNDTKFRKLILDSDEEAYKTVEIYVKKILNNNPNIPYDKYEDISIMAITKALHDYNPDKGAGFLTYLTLKVKAEIKDYSYKRYADEKKVIKEVNDNKDNYIFENNKDKDNISIVSIDNENPEDKMIKEDKSIRQLKAFRMAYSQLPMFSQYILNRLILMQETSYKNDKKRIKENFAVETLSNELGIVKYKIMEIKNFALSLILTKILRSSYLTEEEKYEIKEYHSLNENEEIGEDKEDILKNNLELAQEEILKEFTKEELLVLEMKMKNEDDFLSKENYTFLNEIETKEEQEQIKIDFDFGDEIDDDF